MAHILEFLFLGGLIGWSLFVFMIVHTTCSRRKELEMIEDIKSDIEFVKEEIQKLK
jgi:hypothetical protein